MPIQPGGATNCPFCWGTAGKARLVLLGSVTGILNTSGLSDFRTALVSWAVVRRPSVPVDRARKHKSKFNKKILIA